MTFYDGQYPFYPTSRQSYIFSVSIIIVICTFLAFALIFLSILPGIRGKGRVFWFFRVLLSLFIGVVIVVVNFTSDWEIGSTNANTTYKSFTTEKVNAKIGLHVGLSGINVTLIGMPVNQLNETINYNERFTWQMGRNYDDTFYNALVRGLPNPILYIAEKFTYGSPCSLLVQYRISGQYASITMWVAFCTWIISNILFCLPVSVYGGYMMIITGAFMIFSLISFATVRLSPMCEIHFADAILETRFGGSFWLTLATGILCFIIAFTVIAMHIFCPDKLKLVFLLDEDDADEDDEVVPAYKNPAFVDEENNIFSISLHQRT
ncbi:dual oxidase maturation factor 1-like [Protopterus annectens]|uniref:dual oxidase maturation factor 1-like n=1 Tax=Protopterus annectens TaxID=7888 RepID=UPI001CFA2943|nr:dual oxidase maturation factor 1-like [Protopterus annectens]